MHPVLVTLRLGGRELGIHTYGVMIAVGFAVGIFLAAREGRRQGLDGGRILDLSFWILVAGLIGSRGLYVVVNAREFTGLCAGDGADRSVGQALSDCSRALRIWEGGLVFYGGAIAAAGAVALFVRRQGWSFGKTADVFAPSLAIGHFFGRLGCFAAGCCFGKVCPASLGVAMPSGSVAFEELRQASALAMGASHTPPLHAAQLYEAGGELVLFLVLMRLRDRKRFDGELALIYAAGYAALRMVVEMFRGDYARRFLLELPTPGLSRALALPAAEVLLLSVSQAISAVVMAAAVILWVKGRRRGARTLPLLSPSP